MVGAIAERGRWPGPIAFADAERVMAERRVKKIPLVNADDSVLGLITAKDLIKHRTHPFATRDDRGRRRVWSRRAVILRKLRLERSPSCCRNGSIVAASS